MQKENKIVSNFIIGLFLLIWSVNAFVIFGVVGKFISLFVGFLVLLSCFFYFKEYFRRELNFTVRALLFYLLYFVIAYVQNQSMDMTGFVFSIICFILLIIGFFFGSHNYTFYNSSKKLSLIFVLLAFLGAYFFYIKQSAYFDPFGNSIGRETGDELLNPNGVGYTQALLFIFVYWIYLINDFGLKAKIIIFASMFSVFFIILSTSARGAIMSLSLFLILYNIKPSIEKNDMYNKFIKFIKFIFLIIFLIFFIKLIMDFFPFMDSKLNVLLKRFDSLLYATSEDYSINDRMVMYNEFKQNWVNYIFGKEEYIGYPHNIFLEIFMRWGIFGIPLMVLITKYFFRSIKFINKTNVKKNQLLLLICSLYFFSFLQSLTSLNLEMNRTLWLGLGFLMGLSKNKING